MRRIIYILETVSAWIAIIFGSIAVFQMLMVIWGGFSDFQNTSMTQALYLLFCACICGLAFFAGIRLRFYAYRNYINCGPVKKEMAEKNEENKSE